MNDVSKILHPSNEELEDLRTHLTEKDYDLTVKKGLDLLKTFPDSFLVHNIIAGALMGKGQFNAAKPFLEDALKSHSGYFDALVNLALCYQKEGRSQTADRLFRQARHANPNSIIPLKHMIQYAMDHENWPVALIYLKTARQLQPNDQYIFINLLSVLIEMGKCEHFEAELYSTDFWRFIPKQDLVVLSKSLLKLGDVERVINLVGHYKTKCGNDFVVAGIQGLAAHSTGEFRTAEKRLKVALRHDPNNKTLLNCLSDVYLAEERRLDALECLRKLSQIDSKNHETHYKLSLVQFSLNMIDEARESALASLKVHQGYLPAQLVVIDCEMSQDRIASAKRRAAEIVKEEASIKAAKLALGTCLYRSGDLHAAKESMKDFVAQFPDIPQGHNNLHMVLKALDEVDEAEAALLRALELKPDYMNAAYNLAQLYMESGELQKGRNLLKQVIEADYNRGIVDGVRLNVYVNSKRLDKNDKLVHQLEMIDQSQDERLDASSRAAIKVALAKVYEDVGDTEKSFDMLMEGNNLKKSTFIYNTDTSHQVLNTVMKLFKDSHSGAPFFKQGKYKQNPIFIVGMPRSGTTLIEKILGAHSGITALGELDSIRQVIPKLTLTPTSIQFTGLQDYYDQFGQEIFANLPNFSTPWFTEKTPENYRYIGLIKNAIPDAKFIYCFRSPEAVCWSIYKQYFTADGLSYSFDLDEIVERYNLHSRWMEKWFELLPNDIVINDYQSLTADPEPHLRLLMDKLELPWEAGLLKYEKTKSLARTASFSQVRQGIYKGSTESWKKFESQLRPYFARLEIPDFISKQCSN